MQQKRKYKLEQYLLSAQIILGVVLACYAMYLSKNPTEFFAYILLGVACVQIIFAAVITHKQYSSLLIALDNVQPEVPPTIGEKEQKVYAAYQKLVEALSTDTPLSKWALREHLEAFLKEDVTALPSIQTNLPTKEDFEYQEDLSQYSSYLDNLHKHYRNVLEIARTVNYPLEDQESLLLIVTPLIELGLHFHDFIRVANKDVNLRATDKLNIQLIEGDKDTSTFVHKDCKDFVKDHHKIEKAVLVTQEALQKLGIRQLRHALLFGYRVKDEDFNT